MRGVARPFQIIAHRGASAYAPENTLPAYRRARELGAVEVELDVQLTADGVVMLYHDHSLEKKTGHPGRVGDYRLDELRQVEIGSWFDRMHPEVETSFAGTRLNTLDELFAEMAEELFYHVELKGDHPELPKRTLEVVESHGLRDHVLLTSFHFEQLERVRELDPALPTCLLIRRIEDLGGRTTQDRIHDAAAAGFTEVGVPSRELGFEEVALAHRLGLWVRAWSIKSLEDMEHAIRVGSNGMTIDWPEKLIRRVVEIEGSPGWLGRMPGADRPHEERDPIADRR